MTAATTMVLKPRLSEKSYGLSQTRNTYVFDVPAGVNKHGVARAVAAQFDVTVINVNIANIAGKAKRTVRKSGRSVSGRQSDVRKAYVTLQDGDTLPVFAALEQQAETDGKASATSSKKSDDAKEKK